MSKGSPENRQPPPDDEKSLDDLFALDEKSPEENPALTEKDVPKAAEKRVADIEDELAVLDADMEDTGSDVAGLIANNEEQPSDEPDLAALDKEPPENENTAIFDEDAGTSEEKDEGKASAKPGESLVAGVEEFSKKTSEEVASTQDRVDRRLTAEEEKTGKPPTKEREQQVREEEHNKSRRQIAENSRDDIKDVVRPPSRKGRTESKEQKQKREQLESRIDTVLSDEQGPDGASQFEKHLNDVLRIESIEDEDKREQARVRYLAALQAELGSTPEEARKVYDQLAAKPEVAKLIAQHRQAILIAQHEPDKYDEFVELVEKGDDKAINDFFGKLENPELRKQVTALQENVRVAETVIAIRQTAAQRELKERAQDVQKAAEQLDQRGAGDLFNRLPPEGKLAVVDLVQKSNSVVAANFLSSRPTPSRNGLLTQISGAMVELRFSDRRLYLIGHHAADVRPLNRTRYAIDPATPEQFDDVYMHALMEQNGIDFLQDTRDVTDALALMIASFDPDDNAMMTREQANRYHNMIDILAGGDIPRDEEWRRFRELGLIGSGNRVNTQRMFALGQAMRLYIDDARDTLRHHDAVYIGYEDLVTLTRIWDEKGDGFALGRPDMLPDPAELKRLTRERLRRESGEA